MGDRLKADIGRIRDAGNTIKAISAKFDGAGDLVGGYDDAIGDSYLVGKLHDFASNWDIHRKRLNEDLTIFADWAIKAADAYADGDKQLADALEKGAES